MPKDAEASAWVLPAVLLLILAILLVSLPRGSAIHNEVKPERTLAMIKPDGLSGNYCDKIKDVIVKSGFHIFKVTKVQLDEDKAKVFYSEHSIKAFFPRLIEYIISGPVFAMVLEKANAVSDWRTLIGPTDPTKAKVSHSNSIRAMCGTDIERNCVHGSDSSESAEREIAFFFGGIAPADSSESNAQHDEL